MNTKENYQDQLKNMDAEEFFEHAVCDWGTLRPTQSMMCKDEFLRRLKQPTDEDVQMIVKSLLERKTEKDLDGCPVVLFHTNNNHGTHYIRYDAIIKAFNLWLRDRKENEMKKAIEYKNQLLQERHNARLDDEAEPLIDTLKPDINNLLFMYLPEETTIKDMETLAMVIHEIIRLPEKFLKEK